MSALPCSNSLPWLTNGSRPCGLVTLASTFFSDLAVGPLDLKAFLGEQAFVVGAQFRQPLKGCRRLQNELSHQRRSLSGCCVDFGRSRSICNCAKNGVNGCAPILTIDGRSSWISASRCSGGSRNRSANAPASAKNCARCFGS